MKDKKGIELRKKLLLIDIETLEKLQPQARNYIAVRDFILNGMKTTLNGDCAND